jgi:hypothetical protein
MLIPTGHLSASSDGDAQYGPEMVICTESVAAGYNSGFNPDDLIMVNTAVDGKSGNIILSFAEMDAAGSGIVLPFRQEIHAAYISGDDSGTKFDFGWILFTEESDRRKHPVFSGLSDNDRNGIIDDLKNLDTNRDGVIDARDSRRSLGYFEQGSEIVFYMDDTGSGNGPHFSLREWNTDRHARCLAEDGISRIIQVYETGGGGQGECRPYIPGCGPGTGVQGWLEDTSRKYLSKYFDYHFHGNRSGDMAASAAKCIDERTGTAPTHTIAVPADETPFARVIGFESSPMDHPAAETDYDYDDLVFLIEYKNGGTVQLRSDKALVPKETDAFFTAVEFEVYDYHPNGRCHGKTSFSYFVSSDGGAAGSWVEVIDWDWVQAVSSINEYISPLNWVPGKPEYTRRSRRIDLNSLDLYGNRLVWKAELISTDHHCLPEILAVSLTGETTTSRIYSRASPIVQSNIIYSGSYRTPVRDWTHRIGRGDLTASTLYDPRAPDRTMAADKPLWSAGEQLLALNPDDRNIYYPGFVVRSREGQPLTDNHGETVVGDGATRIFSGTLAHHPVLDSTLLIQDDRERFTEHLYGELRGSFNGKGSLNQATGEWTVIFEQPPRPKMPITADFSYYQLTGRLEAFTTGRLTNSMLGLTDKFIFPTGYIHDFNGDGQFTELDGDWLVDWIRGYSQPNSNRQKEWPLGAIDHSVPALMIPPGYPLWYYGSQVSDLERESYEVFRNIHAERDSVVFVGSRDGMLHAFDAGKFRHGDNPETKKVTENRGYFLWESWTEEQPARCDDYSDKCPNYGTGSELWAFIPASLIPRFKYKLVAAEESVSLDASPSIADVYIDTNADGTGDTWRTVLLSSEGEGGDAVFCLDVTNPKAPQFLWEFGSPDLFRYRPTAAAIPVGRILNPATGKAAWAVFVAGGTRSTPENCPVIYQLDVSGGRLLNRIVLDDAVAIDVNEAVDIDTFGCGKAGLLNGHPVLVDSDGNGYIDRLYISSDCGFIYKINLPDDPDKRLTPITHCVLNTDFSDENDNLLPFDQHWQSIYAPPVITVENSRLQDSGGNNRVRIFFGTGDSPYFRRQEKTTQASYHFFAYVDAADKGECQPDKHYLDWFIELEEGHRIFSTGFAAADQIYFGTATSDIEDPCAGYVETDADKGILYAVNQQGEILLERLTGDILGPLLVEDEHLYFRTLSGLHSLGSGAYNNQVSKSGTPSIKIHAWQEVE